jgi:hypothetical protein
MSFDESIDALNRAQQARLAGMLLRERKDRLAEGRPVGVGHGDGARPIGERGQAGAPGKKRGEQSHSQEAATRHQIGAVKSMCAPTASAVAGASVAPADIEAVDP